MVDSLTTGGETRCDGRESSGPPMSLIFRRSKEPQRCRRFLVLLKQLDARQHESHGGVKVTLSCPDLPQHCLIIAQSSKAEESRDGIPIVPASSTAEGASDATPALSPPAAANQTAQFRLAIPRQTDAKGLGRWRLWGNPRRPRDWLSQHPPLRRLQCVLVLGEGQHLKIAVWPWLFAGGCNVGTGLARRSCFCPGGDDKARWLGARLG